MTQSTVPDMNREEFPVDVALPHVRIASDGAQMRDLFRKHLRPCGGKAYYIRDCTLTRIRHRRAARCILQYNLSLVNSETGREQTQWVTGTIYPRHRAEHIWQRLQAEMGQELSGSCQTFEPISFVPELEMLVQLFPFDRRLPAVPLLMSGPSAELEPLFLSRFGAGDWGLKTWEVQPIRYRAGLAVVLQYTVGARDVATGRRDKRRFYAKIYRDEKGQQVFEVLQTLWTRGNGVGEYFRIGRPIAYLSHLNAVIQEEASGVPFQHILLQGHDQEADSAARRIARAVAALHLDHIFSARNYPMRDEVLFLEKIKNTLEWASPHLKDDLAAIIRAIAGSFTEVPLRPAHLDLKTDHVLLDGDHCKLLDLDSFALADPVLDAAHILAQIFGMRFRNSASHDQLQMAARSFAEEYFNHVPGDWRDRLNSRYAGAALKVAVGFFRRQEPQWPEKVKAMVAEAKRSLTGRIWESSNLLGESGR